MTAKTRAPQDLLLLGVQIAGQLQQAGETWKAIAKEMCDQLPPGEDVERDDIKEAIAIVRQGAEEAGEKISASRLSHVLLVGRRNYAYLTSEISFSAMEEMGNHPRRFEWYDEAITTGTKLTKRDARRKAGLRKLDGPNEAMETYLRLMDEGDEDAVLEFLIKHPQIRAMHDRLSNRAYGLDEDSREGQGRGQGRDPEWESGERLAAELEKLLRVIWLRFQRVAENLGDNTPRGRITTDIDQLMELLSMGRSMMAGVTSIEQYLTKFPDNKEHN